MQEIRNINSLKKYTFMCNKSIFRNSIHDNKNERMLKRIYHTIKYSCVNEERDVRFTNIYEVNEIWFEN